MNSILQKAYTHAEQARNEVVALAHSVSLNQLNHNPAPGKWSALQVLTHLYVSEKLSLSYIKKKSLGIETLDNAGIKQTILMPILTLSQRLPLRFKAPKVVLESTPELIPFDELVRQWDLLRLELHSHLVKLPNAHIHKLVYKHPIAGRLSLPQALQFFAEHINHHKPQIKRTLSFQNKH